MGITSIAAGIASSIIFSATLFTHNIQSQKNYSNYIQHAQVSVYAATKCKTGFKLGKTPVSLVQGAKASCYDVKSAATGKKLLNSLTTMTCYACHSSAGISPASQMNTKLRAQGYTLKPAKIIAAFNAHASEMAGATITNAQAKTISNYLQSIK